MTEEDECQAFYAALGEAISEWSHVEDMLYLVFLGCLSPAKHSVAAAVFYAAENLRTKIQMAKAALSLVMPPNHPEAAEWEKLIAAVSKKAKRRNELAHHQVLVRLKERPGRRYLLRAALIDPLSPSIFDPNQGIGVNELRWRVRVFKVLARRIRDFHERFGEGRPY